MTLTRQDIEPIRAYVADLRRAFHRRPELSMEEYRTAERIEKELDALGIPHERVGDTGVLGVVKGGLPGTKAVVLRADIDALSASARICLSLPLTSLTSFTSFSPPAAPSAPGICSTISYSSLTHSLLIALSKFTRVGNK